LRTLHEGVKSSAPVAFALSLLSTSESIKGLVEIFLRAQDWRMPIEELNMNGRNSAEYLENFVNALREKQWYFEMSGFTEVHLFVQGPVPAGAIIGAQPRNWIPVKLYHKPNPTPLQMYEYWMPLV
jgi:hypothetical protein